MQFQGDIKLTLQEITNLRSSLGSVSTEKEQLAGEVDALKLEVGPQSWRRRIQQGRLGTWVRPDMCILLHMVNACIFCLFQHLLWE